MLMVESVILKKHELVSGMEWFYLNQLEECLLEFLIHKTNQTCFKKHTFQMKIELLEIFIEKDLNYERSGNLGMPKQSLEWRLCPILTTICSNSFLDFMEPLMIMLSSLVLLTLHLVRDLKSKLVISVLGFIILPEQNTRKNVNFSECN